LSKQSQLAAGLFKKIERTRPVPSPAEDGPLIEQGLLCVLLRHLPQDRARSSLDLLRKAYPDWNELRVSQVQEVMRHLRPRSKKLSRDALSELGPAVRDVRTYLQEVFQKTHGLDLEFLREDLNGASKEIAQLTFLGVSSGTYLLWLAGGREIPVHGSLVRVLDRLGLMSRTSSVKRAREQIAPIVPKGKELEFTTAFGEIADRWCDSRKPTCWECTLVEDCVYGRKAFKEWKAQQARFEIQRKREQLRRLEQVRKDSARREREESRERKRLEAEAKKLDRERQRKERVDSKRKEVEAKKRKKINELKRKKETASRQAVKQKAAAKKKAAVKKKAAAKKKKAPARKPAAKSKASKKTSRTADKKKATGKATKKAPARKKAPATKKKAAARKAPRRKTASRRR